MAGRTGLELSTRAAWLTPKDLESGAMRQVFDEIIGHFRISKNHKRGWWRAGVRGRRRRLTGLGSQERCVKTLLLVVPKGGTTRRGHPRGFIFPNLISRTATGIPRLSASFRLPGGCV